MHASSRPGITTYIKLQLLHYAGNLAQDAACTLQTHMYVPTQQQNLNYTRYHTYIPYSGMRVFFGGGGKYETVTIDATSHVYKGCDLSRLHSTTNFFHEPVKISIYTKIISPEKYPLYGTLECYMELLDPHTVHVILYM